MPAVPGNLRNDIWREHVLDIGNAVFQMEFALLQALQLQPIRRAYLFQRGDCGIEVAVFLAQLAQFRHERGFLLLTQRI